VPTDDRATKLWWAVPAAAFLVLIGLAMLFGRAPEQRGYGTSYDASARGFRAAYLLLEELDYPVFRAKRLGEGSVRWVLFPTATPRDAAALDAWVREGGIVLLADDSEEFAHGMGIFLKVEKQDDDPQEEAASGLGVAHLAGGRTRVEWPGQRGRVLVRAGDRPAVTVYPRGRGEIWLINRPEMLTNRLLRRADNAVLLCRLATQTLQKRPGKLAFDEYFHGLRDRPGVAELLLQPPALWATLQGVLLLGLLLWHYIPRFGALRAAPALTRRSKEEFLDAMAALLERKGDYAAAFRVVQDDFARALERELGLPAGAPVEALVIEAARRRPIRRRRLLRVLTGEALPPRAGPATFTKALNELEDARDEFFRG
jgi:hypothetical protein